jgi:hypothetical protein
MPDSDFVEEILAQARAPGGLSPRRLLRFPAEASRRAMSQLQRRTRKVGGETVIVYTAAPPSPQDPETATPTPIDPMGGRP